LENIAADFDWKLFCRDLVPFACLLLLLHARFGLANFFNGAVFGLPIHR
jgi:hypothetical protein